MGYIYSMKGNCLFLLILTSLGSCNGQEKKSIPASPSTEAVVHAKLTKTLGTNKYNNVGSGLLDKAGNLWFGTKGEGLYRYDGKMFTNYTEKDGLSSNFIWSMIEDNMGILWFGTADGISCYDPSAPMAPDGKKFTTIPITDLNSSITHRKSVPDSFGMPYPEENSVWTILQDKKGIFWFGTTNGIFRYDGLRYTHFAQDDGISNTTGVIINKGHAYGVEHILEDKNGNIWFGGRGTAGILYFDGKKLTSFKPDGEHWVWPLLMDKAGNLWFSNWWGVYRYDGKSFFTLAQNDGFYATSTTCITEDKNGRIWFGSDVENEAGKGGLSCFDGKSFSHFTSKDGLIQESVWSITADRAGNLWIGTRNTGLSRYDGRDFTAFSE